MPASRPDIRQYNPLAPIKQISRVNSGSDARSSNCTIPASARMVCAPAYDVSRLGQHPSQVSQIPRSYKFAGIRTLKLGVLLSPTGWLITSYRQPTIYQNFLGPPKSNWALMTSLSKSEVA